MERPQPGNLPLDPVVEAVVTRMAFLIKHLRKVKERALAAYELQEFEYATLQALAAREGRAVPTELVADLLISPAAMTGRLDTLEQRGYVRRRQSVVDRRRVDVELTDAGYEAWRSAVAVVGREQGRIIGTLSPEERDRLAELLRRLLAVAEGPGSPDRADRKP